MTTYRPYYPAVDKPYMVSSIQNPTPLFRHWVNDPLSESSIIYARRSGYNPYFNYHAYRKIDQFINSNSPVFQTACNIILPANKDYLENGIPLIGGTT